jgi:hypothetical protein
LPPWKPAIPEEYIEAGFRMPRMTTRWQRLRLSFTDREAPAAIKRAREIVFIEAGPTRPIPAPNATIQLHRYLLEIIAFTFGVDCDKLNGALKQETSGPTTSILGIQERFDLHVLSLTIQRLHLKVMKDEWKGVLRTTKEYVLRTLVGLALGNEYHALALDLLASYADYQGNPTKWRNTLMGYWSQRWKRCNRQRRAVQSLVSHARLVPLIAPNEEVERLFAHTIEGYQKEKKLKSGSHVRLARRKFEPLTRRGFGELARIILIDKSET